MDWQHWFGFLAVVLVVGAVLFVRRASVERGVDRIADTAGLGVPPEIRPVLLRRTRATRIGELLGAVAGAAIGAAGVALHGDVPTRTFVLQGAIFGIGTAGGLLGGLIAAHALPLPGRRVARERVVRVADYISPVERGGALAAMLLALGVGVTSLASGPVRADVAVAVSTVVAVAAWGAAELIARRIVAQRQPAGTALALAWEDALRAAAIRRLTAAAALIAVFAMLTALRFATRALLPASDADDVVAAVALGALVVMVAVRLALGPTLPGRWFRRRLWPDAVAYAPEPVAS